MSGVQADKDTKGKCFDFEKVATFITPADPVARRLGNRKRNSAEISGVTFVKPKATGISKGIGKTGVHMRYYYNKEEYSSFNRAQKNELYKCRLANKNGGPRPRNTQNNKAKSKIQWKKGRKAEIASLVKKGVEEKLSKMADDKNAEEKQREFLKTPVMGVLHDIKANISSTSQNKQKSFLTAILKKPKK